MQISLKHAKNGIKKILSIRESRAESIPQEEKEEQINRIKNLVSKIDDENIWTTITGIESAIHILRNNYNHNKSNQILDFLTELMNVNDSNLPLTDLKVYELGTESSSDIERVTWREEENKQKPVRIIGAAEILGIEPTRRNARHLIDITEEELSLIEQCGTVLMEDRSTSKEDIYKEILLDKEVYKVFISKETGVVMIEFGEYTERFLKKEN